MLFPTGNVPWPIKLEFDTSSMTFHCNPDLTSSSRSVVITWCFTLSFPREHTLPTGQELSLHCIAVFTAQVQRHMLHIGGRKKERKGGRKERRREKRRKINWFKSWSSLGCSLVSTMWMDSIDIRYKRAYFLSRCSRTGEIHLQ